MIHALIRLDVLRLHDLFLNHIAINIVLKEHFNIIQLRAKLALLHAHKLSN